MDLRKLQIIFYTKGLERRVSDPLPAAPYIVNVCHQPVIFCTAPFRFPDSSNSDLFYRQMHLYSCRKERFVL